MGDIKYATIDPEEQTSTFATPYEKKQGKSTRVLLVEDDAAQAHLIRAILDESTVDEYDVTHSVRLDRALEMLNLDAFDAVLLDLSLPDSEGLYTVSTLHAAQPSVPIVVLTAYDDRSLAGRTTLKGAQAYLYKGDLFGNRLEYALRDAIGRKRAEEDLSRFQSKLYSISQSATIEDLSRTIEDMLTAICCADGWVYGEAWLPASDRKSLEHSGVWTAKVPGLEEFAKVSEGFRLPAGEGIERRTWDSKQITWVYDLQLEMDFLRRPLLGDAGLKSAMFVPILKESEPVALIALFSR